MSKEITTTEQSFLISSIQADELTLENTLLECGKKLNRLKEITPYGEFEKLADQHFKIKGRQRRDLMQIANSFGQNGSVPPFSGRALLALSQSPDPQAALAEAVTRKESGEDVNEQLAQGIKKAQKEAEALRQQIEELKAQNQCNEKNIRPSVQSLVDDGLLSGTNAYIMSALLPELQDQQADRIRSDHNKIKAAEQAVNDAERVAATASSKILAAIEEKNQIKKDFETAVSHSAQEVIRRKEQELEDLRHMINTDMESRVRADVERLLHEQYQSQIKAAEKKAAHAENERLMMAQCNKATTIDNSQLKKKLASLESELEVNTPTNVDNARAKELRRAWEFLRIEIDGVEDDAGRCGGDMRNSMAIVEEMAAYLATFRRSSAGVQIIDI